MLSRGLIAARGHRARLLALSHECCRSPCLPLQCACYRLLPDGPHRRLRGDLPGAARSTLLALHGGHICGEPIDLLGGRDLRDPAERKYLLGRVRETKPSLVTLAWPCTVWGSMADWNFAQGRIPDLPERRAADEEHFLTFVEDVAVEQLQHYRLGLGENPQRSEAKNRQPIVRLLANGYTCTDADQCMYSLKSREGLPQRKRTSFIVPEGSMLEWTLGRTCDGSHMHS